MASSMNSSGSARTPLSGRSNEAIIFNKPPRSVADDGRPKACRPVGINRCSISSNCSYSSKTCSSLDFVKRILRNSRGKFYETRLQELRKLSCFLTGLELLLRIDHDQVGAHLPERARQLEQLGFDLHLSQHAHVHHVAAQRHVRASISKQQHYVLAK